MWNDFECGDFDYDEEMELRRQVSERLAIEDGHFMENYDEEQRAEIMAERAAESRLFGDNYG